MKKLICFLMAVIIIACGIQSAFAAEMPDCKVKLIASHLSANVGDEIKLSLIFENAADYPYGLAAFTAMLSYNDKAVKLESIKAAVPRADIMSNNKAGLVKSLYIFASSEKQPGFNKNDVFYTATFTVLNSTVDIAHFSLTFDAITVSDYSADNEVTNYQVKFNSPEVSVDIIGNEPTESVPSNSSSAPSAPTVSNPTQSKPDAVENDEFKDVESGNNDKISIDIFDDEGNTSSESEFVNSVTSEFESKPDSSEHSPAVPNGNKTLFFTVSAIFASTVICAVVAIVIIIASKNKH